MRQHQLQLACGAGALEMSAKDISMRKNLSAPAIIGEAAILNKELPELATRRAPALWQGPSTP